MMKTIGSYLKEARIKKGITIKKLEKETKIKADFLREIEELNWPKLPELPVILGFIKKISKTLNLSENQAVAMLKRDYPPKNLSINPKPDVGGKFIWSPKMTFILGIVFVAVLLVSYLVLQYISFVNPPKLNIVKPEDGAGVSSEVQVVGNTDPLATIKVNNQPVLVDDKGNFEVSIEIAKSTEEIVVIARSRSGKETVIRRKIVPEL